MRARDQVELDNRVARLFGRKAFFCLFADGERPRLLPPHLATVGGENRMRADFAAFYLWFLLLL